MKCIRQLTILPLLQLMYNIVLLKSNAAVQAYYILKALLLYEKHIESPLFKSHNWIVQ